MGRLIYTDHLGDEMRKNAKMTKKYGKGKGKLQTNTVAYYKNGKWQGTVKGKEKKDAHDSGHLWN